MRKKETTWFDETQWCFTWLQIVLKALSAPATVLKMYRQVAGCTPPAWPPSHLIRWWQVLVTSNRKDFSSRPPDTFWIIQEGYRLHRQTTQLSTTGGSRLFLNSLHLLSWKFNGKRTCSFFHSNLVFPSPRHSFLPYYCKVVSPSESQTWGFCIDIFRILIRLLYTVNFFFLNKIHPFDCFFISFKILGSKSF